MVVIGLVLLVGTCTTVAVRMVMAAAKADKAG